MTKQQLPPRTEAIILLVIGDSTPESPTLKKCTTIPTLQLDQFFGSRSIVANNIIGSGAMFLDAGDPEPIPEPTTAAPLGIGLVGLAYAEVRRRRKKKEVDNS